jgi:predicted metal-dependent hydrolase
MFKTYFDIAKESFANFKEKESAHYGTIKAVIAAIMHHLKNGALPTHCINLLDVPVGESSFLEIALKQIFSDYELKTETKVYVEKEAMRLKNIPELCNEITELWDGIATLSLETDKDEDFYVFHFSLSIVS